MTIEIEVELLVKVTAVLDSFIQIEKNRLREKKQSFEELEVHLEVLKQLMDVLRSKGIL